MKKEDLMPFCDDVRHNLTQPWSRGEYTYATNGMVMIRVPRIESIPDIPEAPNAEVIINKTPEPPEWFPIPEIKLKDKICPKCLGEKKDVKCPECDGMGEVDLHNKFHDYQCECKSCDGDGILDVCPECDGTGRIEPHYSIRVGVSIYSDRYLKLLSALPNCEIGPNQFSHPGKFRFEGGIGLIAPRRE